MANCFRPSVALLVSVLAHAGVALVLFGHGAGQVDAVGRAAHAGHSLTVQLVAPVSPVAPPDSPALDASAPAEALASERVLPAMEGVQGVMRPEPYYFDASVTTIPPSVVIGLEYGWTLIVPGLREQAVNLEVWIRDDGVVDRVELDSSLTPAQQHLFLAEFAKLEFRPARIGRIAVHSHMSMRILVDYTRRA